MRPIVIILWFLLCCQSILPARAEENQAETAAIQLSKEDLEIIKVLEILKMMDLMEDYDMVKDMEILTEENTDEDTD